MDFGTKLKKIRKEHNLNQDQMAEILFTTQGNYSQFENNNRIPSLDIIKRLVEKFNLDANWLLSSTQDQTNNFMDNSSCQIAFLKTEKFYLGSDYIEDLNKKLDLLIDLLSKS